MDYKNVTVMKHPLIIHKISLLRDLNTGAKEFRELVDEIASLMGYEVTRNLPLKEVEIETPVATAKTGVIVGKKLALVPILRAGLGMVDGMLRLMPTIRVGHIGIYREPDSMKAVDYYCKLPVDIAERDVIVVDPMLATGECASAAIRILRERGVKNIKFVCVVAAPEGIKRVMSEFPDTEIYVGAVDEKLNSKGYIIPGLGDAGDRIYGTK
ncbi:MAG: uracil phosphoribosyltransferase [Ruminococcaceae bacterium]|nr:uracil phosphoribosyltransferase [Oscillospiraceae bacterium]